MNNTKIDNLKGQCLIASPSIQDDRFKNTVIYICAHSQEGAMGFVINQKIKDFSFTDLAMQLPIKFGNFIPQISLYQGGPVDSVRGFVLHSTDYTQGDCVETGGGIAVSSSVDILSDIARGFGPKETIIALGYASWEPCQLEKEIVNNDWLVVQASPELIFRTQDENKWLKAFGELHIDLVHFSSCCGRA